MRSGLCYVLVVLVAFRVVSSGALECHRSLCSETGFRGNFNCPFLNFQFSPVVSVSFLAETKVTTVIEFKLAKSGYFAFSYSHCHLSSSLNMEYDFCIGF